MVSFFMAGCKSFPIGRPVNPVELLDGDSDIYISIPKAADSKFIKDIITKSVSGLSSSNLKMILDRTSKVFCGLKINGNSIAIQVVVEGDVPKAFIGSFFNKKNGWDIRSYSSDTSVISHMIYSSHGIDLSFPSDMAVCLGHNVEGMLDRYNMLAYSDIDILTAPLVNNGGSESDSSEVILADSIGDFLSESNSEIRFYAKNPLAFLSLLTGLNLDLKLIDIKGGCAVNSENPEQYTFNIYMNFKDMKYLKAGRAILGFAAGISRSQTEIVDNNGLKIIDINFDRKLLYKLFGL